MHTKENDVKHNPTTSNAKDIAASPAKKMDGASAVPHTADKAKEHMMPVDQNASSDTAKGACGGIGKDGKPQHMAGCNCANKGASQPAADKNGGHKAQGASADHAASSMNAKKDSAMPNPLPKTAAQHAAHK